MRGLQLYTSNMDFIFLLIQLVIFFHISSVQVKNVIFAIQHFMAHF